MITDPLAHVNKRIKNAPVLRGFSHGSPSHGLRPRQNSPLLYSSTARARSPVFDYSEVQGFRLSLTLPCNDSTGVVQ